MPQPLFLLGEGMKSHVLKGSDGRRWLAFEGSGRVVELKDGAPPPKPKRKIIKKGKTR